MHYHTTGHIGDYLCVICGQKFPVEEQFQMHQRSTGHQYCRLCDNFLASNVTQTQHRLTMHEHPCPKCTSVFTSAVDLHNHHRVTGHCYCQECDMSFGSKKEVKQHRRDVHRHACGQCTSVFDSATRLCDHQRKTSHCYCQKCSRPFKDQQAYSQHIRSTIHVSQFRCVECERDFATEQALEQHLKDKKNHGPPERSITTSEDDTLKCNDCDRDFPDRKSLKQHLESVVHRPLSSLRCVASSKCKARFTSPSALLHHLESGSCRSNLTRASLNQLIQSHDTESMITFGVQAKTFFEGSASDDGTSTGLSNSGLITPSSCLSETYSGIGGAPLGLLDLCGTAQGNFNKNGKMLCPICPADSRGFRTMQALGDHLTSAAHAPKIYHCPVGLMSAIKKGKKKTSLNKEFSTLSGLTQHVESGACNRGKQVLEEAMKIVSGKLKELGFKEIKLLK
ncbi:MAG: hypothetical protein Q9192_008134 [Flavoplaca navasiana]